MKRYALLIAAVGALFVAAPGAPAPPHGQRMLQRLDPLNLTLPGRPFRDTVLSRFPAHRRLQLDPGVYTAPDGTQVHVNVSSAYAADAGKAQSIVDLLGFLIHGSELAKITVDVETPAEVRNDCGAEAVACYAPAQMTLITPGENTGDTPVEQVIAHEYGHHIAANRSNRPWNAAYWGTKRWASYVGVCHLQRRDRVFPGAEPPTATGEQYALNPGEGFAESYRHLNELRAKAWGTIGWPIVSQIFFPDQRALALITQDVVKPWSKDTAVFRRTGTLPRNGKRSWSVPTKLDGSLVADVTSGNGAVVRLFDSAGRRVAGPAGHVSFTVCGQRALRIVVSAPRPGRFSLAVGIP